MKIFDNFSLFPGLIPTKSKYEITAAGTLKGVPIALCGVQCIDSTTKAIINLGLISSYNIQV